MLGQIKLLMACLLSSALLMILVMNLQAEDTSVVVAAQANLRLNEFMTANTRSLEDPDELNTFPDWIELYNPGPDAASLDGLYLTNDAANPTLFPITTGLTIPAGGFLVFYADDDPRQGARHTNFTLIKNNGFVGLYSAAAQGLIDSHNYATQTSDVSEGRDVDGTGNWRAFIQVTPGATNMVLPPLISSVAITPTPALANSPVVVTAIITDDSPVLTATLFYSSTGANSFTSVAMTGIADQKRTFVAQIPARPNGTVVRYYVTATDSSGLTSVAPISAPARPSLYVVGFQPVVLYINEFMAENDSVPANPQQSDTFPDWIELYNPGTTPVSLNGLFLTDSANNPTQYAIPNGLTVPAGGFLLFYADNSPELGAQHTNFSLSRGGEYIGLYGAQGTFLVDGYRYRAQIPNISNGRLPDGAAEWSSALCATPGSANVLCNQQLFLPLIQK